MTWAAAFVWTIAIVVGGLVAIYALSVFQNVRTGGDPRFDSKAQREAAEKVAARKRHPSNGGKTEGNQ